MYSSRPCVPALSMPRRADDCLQFVLWRQLTQLYLHLDLRKFSLTNPAGDAAMQVHDWVLQRHRHRQWVRHLRADTVVRSDATVTATCVLLCCVNVAETAPLCSDIRLNIAKFP